MNTDPWDGLRGTKMDGVMCGTSPGGTDRLVSGSVQVKTACGTDGMTLMGEHRQTGRKSCCHSATVCMETELSHI